MYQQNNFKLLKRTKETKNLRKNNYKTENLCITIKLKQFKTICFTNSLA